MTKGLMTYIFASLFRLSYCLTVSSNMTMKLLKVSKQFLCLFQRIK